PSALLRAAPSCTELPQCGYLSPKASSPRLAGFRPPPCEPSGRAVAVRPITRSAREFSTTLKRLLGGSRATVSVRCRTPRSGFSTQLPEGNRTLRDWQDRKNNRRSARDGTPIVPRARVGRYLARCRARLCP